MRRVAIAGVGSTVFGRFPDTLVEDLAAEAAWKALEDAQVDRSAVQAIYLGNFISGVLCGQEVLAGVVANRLGLGPVPCTKMEGACASGGIAFRHAYLLIAAGIYDTVLVLGVEKMSHAGTAKVTEALNCAMDMAHDGVSGLSYPGVFGLLARIYDGRDGGAREGMSAVATKNKRNGLSNPLAQMGRLLTEADFASAQAIADPLTIFDCCPISDGAAAVVLTAADRVRGRLSIEVLASTQASGAASIAGHADLCTFGATVAAAKQAYAEAGRSASDLDFVELHDCFSIAELIDSEDLGVVPRGKGAAWAAEGRTALGGDIPINASGGLLAKGHPVGATGVGQIYEAVLQLRGQHPNQVQGAAIGLTHNLGGTGVACTTTILGRSDA